MRNSASIVLVITATMLAAACRGGGGPEETGAPSQVPTAPALSSPTAAGTATSDDLTGIPVGAIIFNTNRDGNFEIYSMKTDGTGETNLSRNSGYDIDPDVSPDGRTLVFASIRGEGGNPSLYLMSIDGSAVTALTTDLSGDQSPKWAHDGKRIAFSRAGSIWVINADGSDERIVMQSQGDTGENCRSGAIAGGWSPDDARIVYYSVNAAKQEGQVCTVRSDGSDVNVIVSEPKPGFFVEPSWSPDGRRIAYRGIIDGNADIWWVDVETGEQFNVTKSPSIDIEPSWSPGGQWLTFGSNRDDPSNFDIYFVRPDGTDTRRFTHDPNKDSESIWLR